MNQAGNPEAPPRATLATRVLPALPDLLVVALCVAVWWMPERFGPEFVRATCAMMLLEFLALTAVLAIPVAGAVLATALKHDAWIALPFIAYALAAVGIGRALDSPWPVAFFAWLMFSRFGMPWLVKAWDGLGADFEGEWLVGIALWLLLVIPAIKAPFPELPPGFDGPWIVAPHRWLAFAVMYFGGLALYKLLRDPRRLAAAR